MYWLGIHKRAVMIENDSLDRLFGHKTILFAELMYLREVIEFTQLIIAPQIEVCTIHK